MKIFAELSPEPEITNYIICICTAELKKKVVLKLSGKAKLERGGEIELMKVV